MLEKEGKNLDCVNVSTPDHLHQLTFVKDMSISEQLNHVPFRIRQRELQMTQMGIQIHSIYRTAVPIVHDGVIGKIVHAHSWRKKMIIWLSK